MKRLATFDKYICYGVLERNMVEIGKERARTRTIRRAGSASGSESIVTSKGKTKSKF